MADLPRDLDSCEDNLDSAKHFSSRLIDVQATLNEAGFSTV